MLLTRLKFNMSIKFIKFSITELYTVVNVNKILPLLLLLLLLLFDTVKKDSFINIQILFSL
jgi:hypothetical protein